jgi:hypothetical protein
MYRTNLASGRRLAAVWVALGVLALGSGAASAIERKPLPPFTLSDASGAAVESAALVRPGTWLLIYVRPGCLPCQSVLKSVKLDRAPSLPSHIVVIVGGIRAEDLAAFAQQYAELRQAAWYADTEHLAETALGLTGLPITVGLRREQMEWRLAGIPASPVDLPSMLKTWTENP